MKIITFILCSFIYSNLIASDSADVTWGNQYFYDMGINDTITFLGKKVILLENIGPSCRISIDGVVDTLVTATRHLPVVINGVRVFVAWNRDYDKTSSNTYGQGIGENLFAECVKDAYICLSDPSLPLLDSEKYTFPIERSGGFDWKMSERTHNMAWVSEPRIHEGMDIDMHTFRNTEETALLAIEKVRCVDKVDERVNAWLLMESVNSPGIYYGYRHIRGKSEIAASSITVNIGDTVSQGHILGYIHGDKSWGHLHWTVMTRQNDFNHRCNWMINSMPAMYELWYGTCQDVTPAFTGGDWKLYDEEYWKTENYYSGLYRYSDMAGHGLVMGDWNPTMCVEFDSTSVILKNEVNGFTNPNPYYDYEIKVENGVYKVSTSIGAPIKTWQKVYYEGDYQGTYNLDSGQYTVINANHIPVSDGKLTLRIEQKGSKASGITKIHFKKQ